MEIDGDENNGDVLAAGAEAAVVGVVVVVGVTFMRLRRRLIS